MKLETKIDRALKNMDIMILACKAKGGYKFRERFRYTDFELEKVLEQCEIQLRAMAVSLIVAEQMLSEPPPSIHSRWQEYERRRKEVAP